MITLYTIGHSNHPVAELARLLRAQAVAVVVDVRSAPYSRHHPQFNREALQASLSGEDTAYVFEGQALGGRPKDPTCYKGGQLPEGEADLLHEVDYAAIMTRPWFLAGIERLLALAAERTVAILCSEEDPSRCHRHHLVARHLIAHHPEVDVQHIRKDGAVFSARSLHASPDEPSGEQLSLF